MSFVARQLGFAYGLHDASFEFPRNGLITIAGPNGAGKSTLLGILAGLRSPYRGSCTYDGREVRQWPKRDFARRVAFLPQSVRLEFPFTAEEVVLMGRTPYAQRLVPDRRKTVSAAEEAMTITDTLAFRGARFSLALRRRSAESDPGVGADAAARGAAAGRAGDAPGSAASAIALPAAERSWRRSLLVVAVTHDLNLALQFSNRVMVLEDGRIAGDGAPEEVLNPALIARVFGVQATLHGGLGVGGWMSYEA